jgi:cell wall-associated NlpC family hydrolase
MSDKGRSPSRLLVYALAMPIFALVYATTFGGRIWSALRPAVATLLGVSVIGSLYAEVAYRKTPTPMRAGAVVALAVVLVVPSLANPRTVAAASPTEAVISAAMQYVGKNFQLGAEGPRNFDCSGLVYRAFADAGELPRIGGMRLRAAGYMHYFVARGRFTKNAAQAQRGDLVIYNMGEHIGIYLGNGRVISALVNPWGVSVHSLYGIHQKVSYFLRVNWGGGDATSGNTGRHTGGNGTGGKTGGNTGGSTGDNGNGGNSGGGNTGDGGGSSGPGTQGEGDQQQPQATNAVALGTMNLRDSADPSARIIGWVGRGASFTIIDKGTSPAGFVWYQVQTNSGKQGWVYSRWVSQQN